MINVKKSKGTIVSRSVLPSTKPLVNERLASMGISSDQTDLQSHANAKDFYSSAQQNAINRKNAQLSNYNDGKGTPPKSVFDKDTGEKFFGRTDRESGLDQGTVVHAVLKHNYLLMYHRGQCFIHFANLDLIKGMDVEPTNILAKADGSQLMQGDFDALLAAPPSTIELLRGYTVLGSNLFNSEIRTGVLMRASMWRPVFADKEE